MQDVWTEDDVPLRASAGYRISPGDYKRFRAHLIGTPVRRPRFSADALARKGWTSWKQYQLHCTLGNF